MLNYRLIWLYCIPSGLSSSIIFVTLVCDNRYFITHKLILLPSSAYYISCFYNVFIKQYKRKMVKMS